MDSLGRNLGRLELLHREERRRGGDKFDSYLSPRLRLPRHHSARRLAHFKEVFGFLFTPFFFGWFSPNPAFLPRTKEWITAGRCAECIHDQLRALPFDKYKIFTALLKQNKVTIESPLNTGLSIYGPNVNCTEPDYREWGASHPSWLPANPMFFKLELLPVERRKTYFARFFSGSPKGGWLMQDMTSELYTRSPETYFHPQEIFQ